MTLTAAGPAPRRYSRKPFSKGWRPANADAAEQFRELTNIMTSGSSPNEIQNTLSSAAFSVPFTTPPQRSGRGSPKEPPTGVNLHCVPLGGTVSTGVDYSTVGGVNGYNGSPGSVLPRVL